MLSLHNQTVNVNRVALIEVLKKNMEQHVNEYSAAVAGYQEAMLKTLQETVKKVKKGEVNQLYVHLPKPESHEGDYKDVIEMLEVSVDPTIQLDKSAFQAYYKDQWGWSAGFKTLAASYIPGGAL